MAQAARRVCGTRSAEREYAATRGVVIKLPTRLGLVIRGKPVMASVTARVSSASEGARPHRIVDTDGAVETSMARKLAAGDPGFGGRDRPVVLVTTPDFLRRFGLSSLGELPPRPGLMLSAKGMSKWRLPGRTRNVPGLDPAR